MALARRHDLRPFEHAHAFADAGAARREKALTAVVLLTLVTMVAELVAGWWSGSLALTADGWHMGTHALALGGAVLAYRLSARAGRQRALPRGTPGFPFGGWKIEVLAAYTSGLLLAGVSLWLVIDAIDVLRHPRPVAYGEAMGVAVIGLLVNLASAWMLSRAGVAHEHGSGGHGHGQHQHDHDHDHGHDHAHEPGPAAAAGSLRGHAHDHNFGAAYLHVVADAFTSVLAILALAGGLLLGWGWLDPAVALLAAAVIAHWSFGVLKGSALSLVDATEDPALAGRIRQAIESDGDAQLADLHVWQVGSQAWSAVVSVVADAPQAPDVYRARLAGIEPLRHVTVEVHRCPGCG